VTAARPWPGRRVCVAGARVVGIAAAEVLLGLGAEVVLVDAASDDIARARVAELPTGRLDLRLGDGATLPEGVDLLVVSPGFPPDAPIVRAAQERGVPVWGDIELAWHLRPAKTADWLALTGTNGKTTTVRMLEAMLVAAGHRAVAAGNIGLPLLAAVLADEPYDVLAVELSSYQLHYSSSVEPYAAAVLNVAPDHLDWHGGLEPYADAKARIYRGTRSACIYNASDQRTAEMVRTAAGSCRAVGFTLGVPEIGMVGLVDDVLVDRAFVDDPANAATELATLADVVPAAPHNVENALAAAALARAYGVPPEAVRDGLRAFRPEPHRIATVAVVEGATYVDDSKATNTHAAAASLRAYEHVVWLAGGLAKGAAFDDLVVAARSRLRAAVLFGRDRAVVAEALARHAPQVPVVDLDVEDTEDMPLMDVVVGRAAALARPGDTVLLAPACASMDQFRDYSARGDAFAAAVERLAAR
jgi:UDP-N-acetylmuramoylalanine--D-glutamate ligase